MVDLHLHTTASDGSCEPEELVRRAGRVGITTLSVTDHDTMAATTEVEACAGRAGLDCVPGIEITAIHEGADVHVLGYFLDPGHGGLQSFLEAQRRDRVRRVEEMVQRLDELGAPLAFADVAPPSSHRSGRSVGRPQVARALVASGHVGTIQEAFDRFIGEDGPAYVARRGVSPPAVFDIIQAAGGVASLAHPALQHMDAQIPGWASAGLGALEVRHSEHDASAEDHYRRLATRLGLAVSGGSDYHGEPGRWLRLAAFGTIGITAAELDALRARAATGGA